MSIDDGKEEVRHENGYRAPDKPPYVGMSPGRYIATRFSTLKPPMLSAPNPWRLVRMLNRHHWAFFSIAFAAWTWDAFDFFTVSLTVTDLAKQFDKSKTDITWGITLVLMFRSVGSIIFGIAADRYGRKWPFIVNNVLFIVLELVSQRREASVSGHRGRSMTPSFERSALAIAKTGGGHGDSRLMCDIFSQGTGFCQTYGQFLACRALFGIAMGGLYGNAAATALEDLPEETRGLMSGILQQGVSGQSLDYE